jgi:hypothetical protein
VVARTGAARCSAHAEIRFMGPSRAIPAASSRGLPAIPLGTPRLAYNLGSRESDDVAV